MLTHRQFELLRMIHTRIRDIGVPPSLEEMKEALGLRSKSGIHRLLTTLEERGFIRRFAHRARAIEIVALPRALAGPAGALLTGHADSLARVHAMKPGMGDIPAHNATEGLRSPVSADSPSHNGDIVSSALPAPPRLTGGTWRASQVQGVPFTPAHGSGPAAFADLPLVGRVAAGSPIAAIENPDHTIAVPDTMLGRTGEHYALEVEGESMLGLGILDGDTIIVKKTNTANDGDVVVALVADGEATLKKLHRKGKSIILKPANPDFPVQVFPANQVTVQGRLVGLIRHY